MRRLFLIFLLVLLPLQASWAAVCAYCPGGCIVEAQAKPASTEEQGDQAAVLVADDDCTCCQLGGVGITSADPVAAFTSFHALVDSDATMRFASIRPDRPERPKWSRSA
jgi:anaerobic selenocysteine-containing dehydrogenase